jgi:hypothetical protein
MVSHPPFPPSPELETLATGDVWGVVAGLTSAPAALPSSPLACYSLALSAPHMFPRRRIPAPVALDSSAPQPSTPQAASPPNPPCRRSPRTSPRHWRDAQSRSRLLRSAPICRLRSTTSSPDRRRSSPSSTSASTPCLDPSSHPSTRLQFCLHRPRSAPGQPSCTRPPGSIHHLPDSVRSAPGPVHQLPDPTRSAPSLARLHRPNSTPS